MKGVKIAVLDQSYGDFAEWVDFAYWWSCIWKGLRLQPAQQACFNTPGVAGAVLKTTFSVTNEPFNALPPNN